MDAIGRVLIYIGRECDGECIYVKARDIGEAVGLTSREAAVKLLSIGRCDDVPIDVEKWSATSGSTTYRVSVRDTGAVAPGEAERTASLVA